mgnify:CR=1 FL=1
MSETDLQQTFFKGNLHFNIRQTKKDVPTPLYAVFTINGRQSKVPTGVKVMPSQWVNEKQVAIESNVLPRMQNRNNRAANKQLSAILGRYKKVREQLDDSPEAWGNILDIITLSITGKEKAMPEAKITAKEKKKKESLILYLNRIIEKRGAEKGTNMRNYSQCVTKLKVYMDAAKIEDDVNVLGLRLMNGFKQWLEDSSGLQVKTIREMEKSLKFLIEYINRSEQREGADYIDIRSFVQTKDNRKKEDKQAKSEPLTVEEVTMLWNLKELTPKEEEARDIFVAQCLCGQRISDLPKVLSDELEITTIDGVDVSAYEVGTATKASSSYMSILPNATGTMTSTVTVYTNNTAGYTLKLKDADSKTALTGTMTDTIPAGATTTAGTAAWSVTGGDDAFQTAAAITAADQTVKTTAAKTSGGDATTMTYTVSTNSDQEAGVYSDVVTYTASTN